MQKLAVLVRRMCTTRLPGEWTIHALPVLYQALTNVLTRGLQLEGHKATVEDVVFKASSEHELASVGDDRQLMMWDTRSPAKVRGSNGSAPRRNPAASSAE